MTKPDDAPAWDGRPERPDEDGWHWFGSPHHNQRHPVRWSAEYRGWSTAPGWFDRDPDKLGVYLGPCAPPGEFRRGFEAAREAAARVAETTHARLFPKPRNRIVAQTTSQIAAQDIRAMEPPA
jgi:hypothetical protein